MHVPPLSLSLVAAHMNESIDGGQLLINEEEEKTRVRRQRSATASARSLYVCVCVCVDQKGISDDGKRRKKREEDRQIDRGRESERASAQDGKSRANDEREQRRAEK